MTKPQEEDKMNNPSSEDQQMPPVPNRIAALIEPPESEKPIQKEKKHKYSPLSQHVARNWVGDIVIGLIFLTLLVGAIFYALQSKPFHPLSEPTPYLTSTTTLLTTSTATNVASLEPAFIILGQYDGKIYTFNTGIGKIYSYDPATTDHKDQEVTSAPKFETFLWHDSGKVLLVSDAENLFGNIYLLDLTQPSPKPILLTQREAPSNFPRDLEIDGLLPMSWSLDGNAFTFVARDASDKREWLLIYELSSQKFIYTPARSMDRISSPIWITRSLTSTGTIDLLTFVAISGGQEDRYFVDRSGGGFEKWIVK